MKLKSLFVVLLTGVALSDRHRMDPNSSEAKHQAIFEETPWTSEDMGGMLRGRLSFDTRKFRVESARLHQLADQPWQRFPSPRAGEEDEDTRAKDEVWQRQQKFKAATQVFIDTMNRLQDNTRQATLTSGGVRKNFVAVKDICEACHRKFRAL